MPMKIKIWGGRGSLPSPQSPNLIEARIRSTLLGFAGSEFASQGVDAVDRYLSTLPRHQLGGFGGNTPCIEVSTPEQHLIIDAGSGLRVLGRDMLNGPCGKGQGKVNFLFTHFHWDHLIGMPFFAPFYIKGNQIRLHAVQADIANIPRLMFQKPYFPINADQLGAEITPVQIAPRKVLHLGDLQITPYQLDHPDPCWGFRIEHEGKVFSYCIDSEIKRSTREDLGPDLPLYQNVDLMILDAQYSLTEQMNKTGWGHGAATIGLDIAMREDVKEIVFAHFDPDATDDDIARVEKETERYYRARLNQSRRTTQDLHEVKWSFAYEGREFNL
jgi:phosphoribosyl 1,2-cyclic phosphodiesterase